jgi:hypothetical protein
MRHRMNGGVRGRSREAPPTRFKPPLSIISDFPIPPGYRGQVSVRQC